jgi:uncharacterized protein (TIGR03382 family)
MIRSFAVLSALVCAGAATAGFINEPGWLQIEVVDNGGISDGSGANLAGSTTYDLYWSNQGYMDLPSIGVNGFNLGTAAQPDLAPYRVFYTGTAFNHAFGSDGAPNPALIPAFPALAFDSFFDVGGSPVSFVPGSAAFGNGEVIGTWFTQPPVEVAFGERIRFLRLTLLDGGEIDFARTSIEVGFSNNTTAVFGIPAPGAAALLGLGGLVAGRRRR